MAVALARQPLPPTNTIATTTDVIPAMLNVIQPAPTAVSAIPPGERIAIPPPANARRN
jgi:hypothetical protein